MDLLINKLIEDVYNSHVFYFVSFLGAKILTVLEQFVKKKQETKCLQVGGHASLSID